MGVMMCSAMLDEPPVPNFCADRPFLAVIFVDNVPFFYTTIFGLEE